VFSIVDLNKLKVSQIVELAKECKLNLKGRLKADKIKEIMNSGIEVQKLHDLFNKYYSPKKSVKKKTPTTKESPIIKRINLLEKQVKFIMDKITSVELIISQQRTEKTGLSGKEYENSKNKIISLVKPGRSLTIDQIYQTKKFKNLSLEKLGRIIDELVDEELFDISEGGSKLIIHGNIGRIIRR